MSEPIPFPGPIGGTIRLPAPPGKTITIPASTPTDPPPFQVGDVCTFSRFAYRFRVTRIDGDDVTFERIS